MIIALPIRVPDEMTDHEARTTAWNQGLALVIDRFGRALMRPYIQPGDVVLVRMNPAKQAA